MRCELCQNILRAQTTSIANIRRKCYISSIKGCICLRHFGAAQTVQQHRWHNGNGIGIVVKSSAIISAVVPKVPKLMLFSNDSRNVLLDRLDRLLALSIVCYVCAMAVFYCALASRLSINQYSQYLLLFVYLISTPNTLQNRIVWLIALNSSSVDICVPSPVFISTTLCIQSTAKPRSCVEHMANNNCFRG